MKIDYQHSKRLLNSARPTSVDAIVLAKSLSETSKIAELKSLIDATKNNMKSREVIVITITTH